MEKMFEVNSKKCSEADNCKCVKEYGDKKYCAGCGSVVNRKEGD